MSFTAQLGTANSFLGNEELGIADPAPPISSPMPAPEFTTGPRIPGAPWRSRVTVEYNTVQFVTPPPPARPSSQMSPEFRIGPPMQGAPFFRATSVTNPPSFNLPAPTFVVNQTVIAKQKVAFNPDVLASGRRPERPGETRE